MKKIYFFLSAACISVSASAVQKDLAVRTSQPIKAETVQSVKYFAGEAKATANFDKAVKAASLTRAGETPVLAVIPESNLMAFGPNPAGSMYAGLGFASSYGSLDFYGLGAGISDYKWIYSNLNDYEESGQNLLWNEKTANTPLLNIKSGIGLVNPPVLYGTPENGGSEMEASTNYNMIYCGGGADYWGLNAKDIDDEDAFGVTFYQNVGLLSGNYNGGSTASYSYSPNAKGFDENGVYSSGKESWKSRLEAYWFEGQTVSDIKFNNFTIIQPAPESTYMMTRGWIWMNVEVSAATQLISYIYPLDEEGYIEEMPIAIGYASIPATGADTVIFYYVPLNEEGDEIEDVVYIDSAVAITIEGFADNTAIKSVTPVSGYAPFNYNDYVAGNYDLCKEPDLYVNFSLKANGEQYNDVLVYNVGLYGFGDEDDMLTSLTYAQYTMDATFAYIHSVDGVDSVNLPKEGGKASVEIEALYYNIAGMLEQGYYELTAPEWLNVEVSAADDSTGQTTLTVSAAAGEDRTGYVEIKGLGATYSLQVNQGEGNAVSTIVVDKNAEYYDLAGRRIANPEKGIYIKKTGNKAEKVLF